MRAFCCPPYGTAACASEQADQVPSRLEPFLKVRFDCFYLFAAGRYPLALSPQLHHAESAANAFMEAYHLTDLEGALQRQHTTPCQVVGGGGVEGEQGGGGREWGRGGYRWGEGKRRGVGGGRSCRDNIQPMSGGGRRGAGGGVGGGGEGGSGVVGRGRGVGRIQSQPLAPYHLGEEGGGQEGGNEGRGSGGSGWDGR